MLGFIRLFTSFSTVAPVEIAPTFGWLCTLFGAGCW